ncbi:hypothetical protein [Devosia elaeis]|uniref:Uncharacterized protein n=1 Tax=Devosia elaeis TaxID=1770058 RepID=A0A178HLT7_9HYPH|nr:hypothetical protein [Devosia elaeis]OAM73048.1 hypothetical protein A3840_18695 [Devosia elaeis]
MIEAAIFLTGLTVWGIAIGGIALLLGWLVFLAVISAWHVVRVYRHGWVLNPEMSFARSMTYPFRMWAYFWLQGPPHVTRMDGKGGRIARPLFKLPPERIPG